MRTEYVPVALPDWRPRDVRWDDSDYLRSVSALATNGVFMGEVSDALTACREAADAAKTPEELAGVQVGIRVVKALLTMSARARAKLNDIKARNDEARDTAEHSQLG